MIIIQELMILLRLGIELVNINKATHDNSIKLAINFIGQVSMELQIVSPVDKGLPHS